MNRVGFERQIDAYESRIQESYYVFQEESSHFCDNVSEAMSNRTRLMTFWPLLISLIGIVMCFSPQLTLIGVVLVIVGCVGSYYSHKYAKTKELRVRSELSNFKRTLDRNMRI